MNLQSLGSAAAFYQRSPQTLARAVQKIQAEPPLTLNGVAYFRVEDIEHALNEVILYQGELEAAAGLVDHMRGQQYRQHRERLIEKNRKEARPQ